MGNQPLAKSQVGSGRTQLSNPEPNSASWRPTPRIRPQDDSPWVSNHVRMPYPTNEWKCEKGVYLEFPCEQASR